MSRAIVVLLVSLPLILAGCPQGQRGGSKGGAKPFPVAVEEVKAERVEYSVGANGSVEAKLEVSITSRVSGVLEAVNFMEGTRVTTDTVLAEIEPRRFKLERDAAAAAYQRAQAELSEAQAGLQRRESGAAEGNRAGIFSKEEVDAWRTKVSVAKANEAELKAELDRAELDYQNAFVRSPIAGVIEEKSVRLGQWVQPGDRFARIVKTDELLLRFAVPEEDASQLKAGMPAEFNVVGAGRKRTATIAHVQAYAEQVTRMVTVLAEVGGEHVDALTPGAFVRVRVPVGSNDKAITVMETAIRPSERGFLVFVIGDDNKAEERVITTGLRTPSGRIEVTSGLKPNERVVTSGADALRDGADVTISTEPAE